MAQLKKMFTTRKQLISSSIPADHQVGPKKIRFIGKLNPKMGFQLFDSYVLPVLEYNCEIWATRKYESIEKVQLKFLKMLLGVKNSTCTQAVLGETGRFPIALRHKVRIVKYWIRLQRLEPDSIVKKAFNMLNNLHELGFRNWVSQVHEILYEFNMENFLEEGRNVDYEYETSCVNLLKDRCYSHFMSSWKNSLSEKTILRTYVKFKEEFCLESYLLYVKDYRLRTLISKFRLSSHDYAIEKGRHVKPKVPLEQRICSKCGTGLEDELHVLLTCDYYHQERCTFKLRLSQLNIDVTDDVQRVFVTVLSSKDENVLFTLGKFLEKIELKRKAI
jgi:hypothetical protein